MNTAIGDVYLSKGDLKSAGKYFQAALAQNSHDPVAANNLAWVYAVQGENLDMALSLATQAKQTAPDMTAVNDTLAWIQYKKGNYRVSISLAEDAVKKDPEKADYRYHLGMALNGSGRKGPCQDRVAEGPAVEPEGRGRAGSTEDPGVSAIAAFPKLP